MVNFRFHLVSLTAVFFALALGVTVGATVLQRTTIDTLENQVSRVETRLDTTDKENEDLRTELALRDRFAEQAADRLVQGRLAGVPVVLVGVEGVDRAPVDALRDRLTAAGATLESVVWFRGKLSLTEDESVTQLAELLGTTASRPDPVRRQLVEALARDWRDGARTDLLDRLRDGGFIDYESSSSTAPPTPGATPGIPLPDRRFVIVSGSTAAIANDDLASPLTEDLVSEGDTLVLAAEPGIEDGEGNLESEFVTKLRANENVAGRLSTVDNLGRYMGRTAAILALEDLGSGRLGHYGMGDAAERLVPAPAA